MSISNKPPVAAALAAILTALFDCEKVFVRIRQKRADTLFPGPSKIVHEAIKQAEDEIRGQQKLSNAFQVDDDIAENALKAIAQDLRTGLLEDLFRALADDSKNIGAGECIQVEKARRGTLSAMTDLYTRLSSTVPEPEPETETQPPMETSKPLPILPKLPIPLKRSPSSIAPEVAPVVENAVATSPRISRSRNKASMPTFMSQVQNPISKGRSSSFSSIISPIKHRTSSFSQSTINAAARKPSKERSVPRSPSQESPAARRPSQDGNNISYLPQMTWFRRKSSTKGPDIESSDPPESAVSRISSDVYTPGSFTAASPGGASQSDKVSASPSSTRAFSLLRAGSFKVMQDAIPEVESIHEASPSVSRRASVSHSTTHSPPHDDSAHTVVSLGRSGTRQSQDSSTISSTPSAEARAFRKLLRLPYGENGYLGYCKGAVALQRGNDNAFLEQQEMTFGKVSYLMCSECAFTGRISTTKIWGDAKSLGLYFKWAFLAKSHVEQNKVKNSQHAYLCMFCVFLGEESRVTQGTDAFLRHVATHRGQDFSDALLERVRCVTGRTAAQGEDFDINLLPLDKPKPVLYELPEDDVVQQKHVEGPFEMAAFREAVEMPTHSGEEDYSKYSWADTPS